jgi:histidinol-phosphatase (PHP family)
MDLPVLYAKEALKNNLNVLGFSAHAPLPFPCTWTLPLENYPDYLEEITSLKRTFSENLEILCGLEIDYIPELWPQVKTTLNPSQLDYFIGSIHFIDQFNDGTRWSIDGSNEEFRSGWIEIFEKDSYALTHKYFEYTRQMVRDMKPPIIGHLDKIKMQYRPNCFIPESDPFYRNEVMQTLEEIAATSCIVEVNTRGVYKRNEESFYPSKWVLEEMAKLRIPVMVNSDAHRPHEISLLYDKAIEQLREAGFRQIMYLSQGKWIEQPLP